MHIAELKPQSIPSLRHPLSPALLEELPRPAVSTATGDGAEECLLAAMLAADALDVPLANVLAASRGSRTAAHARQVAMYLSHVALGIPVVAVGRCFSRDHSTVAHGCRRVEDLRDERSFDALIAELALAARITRHLDHEVLA